MAGVVPDSGKRAFAIAPAPGSTHRGAEHIVILMQENRSFDHALGSLQGVRGFNDLRAIRQPNGNLHRPTASPPNLALHVSNAGSTPKQVAVKDHSYGLAPMVKTVAAGATEQVVM